MTGKRRKRFWSDDEKREICQQTTLPRVSIAQVAQRYTVNANLIHKWLKDPRFAPQAEETGDVEEANAFLPVEVSAAEAAHVQNACVINPAPTPSASRVDITLSDGRRILVEGPTALASVVGLVQGLMV
ncbi:MAG: transposase [Pseudoprimorskyibacter sp.]|nr:transposase [Pseudoprimorskyibacter sp.]